MRQEAVAIELVADRLNDSFAEAVETILACPQQVIVTGMGKAGWIGQKIAATLASTGTRSHFVHPAEAIHGDLGRIHVADVVLLLSMSGETEELLRMVASLQRAGIKMVAITRQRGSTLGKSASIVLELGDLAEACPLGLAPTTSTSVMLALGDALALVVSQQRGFLARDFARYHPGGSLGRQLTLVDQMMRPREQCRLAHVEQTVREVFVAGRKAGRRSGAVMIINPQEELVGIFTDSDLARLLENQRDAALDQPVQQVMTHNPRSIACGTLMPEALKLLRQHRISELPVVDGQRHPVGMLDITDLVDFFPGDEPHPRSLVANHLPANQTTPGNVERELDGPAILPFPSPVRRPAENEPRPS